MPIEKRICIIIREAMEGTFSCFYSANACFVVQLSLLFMRFAFLVNNNKVVQPPTNKQQDDCALCEFIPK